jgi:hypothetical protein
MRTDEQRIAKYLAKTVPATMSLKVAAVLTGMKSGFASATESLVAVETQVQALLNDAGKPTIHYPFYLSFARELWKLTRNGINGDSAQDVAQPILDKWEDYGLDGATLVAIADNVFSMELT